MNAKRRELRTLKRILELPRSELRPRLALAIALGPPGGNAQVARSGSKLPSLNQGQVLERVAGRVRPQVRPMRSPHERGGE